MVQSAKNLWQLFEKKRDGIAMYRTVTLALVFLAICSLSLGLLRIIPYSATEQSLSLVTTLGLALLTNFVCSRLWRISVNNESAVITALIIFFLIIPANQASLTDLWVIAVVTFLAILSKFVLTWRGQHILNPAAFGAVALALIYWLFSLPGYFESIWWIGQRELLLPLLIAGAIVVSKVRKRLPVLVFLVVTLIVFMFEDWRYFGEISTSSLMTWLSGPSLFLAFFMLTEPFTTPPTKSLQTSYAALVGFISQTTLLLGLGIKITPELALVVGNLAFYPTTLRQKLKLPLHSIREVAQNTYEFAFTKPTKLNFKAGQYLEWMLPHAAVDSRGIRRYFTIASSPAASEIKIGVRFGEKISSYKTALLGLKPGDSIIASQLAGDFTLPKNSARKLAWVAGGIGITPFMSQLGFFLESTQKNDTVLFYCNNTKNETAYFDQLQAAAQILPLKVVHIFAKENIPGSENGYLTADIIKKQAPDFVERDWYLSGPPGMVNAYAKLLRELNVPSRQIKKDFFPGLA